MSRRAAERGVDPAVWLRTVESRPEDLADLIAAATVPHTAFFRHPEQIQHLRAVLPTFAKRRSPVRVWSAGCATGEEPWTIALVAEELAVPVDIVATDVSAAAIAKARRGHYEARDTRSLPGYLGTRPFVASEALRRRVRFRLGSILGPAAPEERGPFDLIFCRNVLIYFDAQSIDLAWRVFEERLAEGGAIVVAPVEALLRVPPRLGGAGPLGWIARVSPAAQRPGGAEGSRARVHERSIAKPVDADALVLASFEKVARFLRSDDTDSAERHLHALLSGRDDALGWFLLGETCARRGEVTQARIAYERATRATMVPPEVDLETVQSAAKRRARQLG